MKTMFQNFLLILLAWGSGAATPKRQMTLDTLPENSMAIKFRMNAGFQGDVNRTHPASVEPVLNDEDNGLTWFGQLGVINAAKDAVRSIGVADQSDNVSLMIWGVSTRPYPVQQQTGGMSSDFGGGGPVEGAQMDVLRTGYIMATLNDPSETPGKGDPVYVWCAASAGDQILGGITKTASAGNTVKIANAVFNGLPDAGGNVEIIVGDRRSL